MLKHRLVSALIMAVALIAAVIWLPDICVPAALVVIGALALWEFYSLLDAAGIPNFRVLGVVGGVGLIVATWVSLRTVPEWRGIAQPGVILALLLVSFIRQIHSAQTEKPLVTIAGTMLGFLYVAFLFNFFTSILGSWNKTDGRLLLFFMLLVTKFTDIGAYSIGCAIGRHKFMPRISPAKSWEGCIGGVLTATMVGFIYYFFVRRYFVCVTMTWIDVAILGPVLAICGIMGDLTESLFKRAADMKDSGTSIRGMGGILDVFDSLLFAAPVLYYYAFIFMR